MSGRLICWKWAARGGRRIVDCPWRVPGGERRGPRLAGCLDYGSHLAAGEFAPAIALAQQATSPEQRNAWLAEIAAAQARAGMREASFRSAAEIGDDRLRAKRSPMPPPCRWAARRRRPAAVATAVVSKAAVARAAAQGGASRPTSTRSST